MKVGFIGLGTMGLPMVRNLSKAGHELAVYDLLPAPTGEARVIKGVSVKDSIGEVVAGSEVIFTCLTDNEVVRTVYLGAGGIAEAAATGQITCDTSTVGPEVTQEIHQVLMEKGVHHLDAPMLGTKPQAVDGSLFFIVGGEEAGVIKLSPLLDAMGRMHLFVGPPGSANRMKIIHNSLSAVIAVGVAESLALCLRSGVDAKAFYDVVCTGGGMAYSTYFDQRAGRILSGEFSPTFTLDLMHKDVVLAMGLADRTQVPLPMMEEARKTFAEAAKDGWGQDDFSAVSHVIEKRLGAKFFGK